MKSKSILNSKLAMMLLSLVVAFGLWLYVITVVSPGSETTIYDVPVVMQGETMLTEKKLMITGTTDTTVDLRLAGNRTDLNKLDKSNITVTVDLTKVYDPGMHDMRLSYVFPSDIPNDAVTVQSSVPGYVRISVEERVEKEVPVNVVYTGTIPANYVKDKETLSISAVTVVGPKSVMDTITQAVVEVDLTGQTNTIVQTKDFTLCNDQNEPVVSDLVTTNDDIKEVEVTVPIVMVKEIPLKLTVVPGGGATEENSTIEMSQTTLSVSGPEAILTELNELVLGTVDLGAINEPQTLEFEIKLPEGVTNETGVTVVTVQISFPELETKVLRVDQIQYTNLPQGMKAELMTQVMDVTIRGSKTLVSKMTEADLVVMIDLTGAQEGTDKYTATIVVSEMYSEVGAVGSYTVTAKVSPEEAE